jgi:hypothetical protein
MMEHIEKFIDDIISGDNIAAKESVEAILSAKAFDALQGRKQEIATTLFGGQEESSVEEPVEDEAN